MNISKLQQGGMIRTACFPHFVSQMCNIAFNEHTKIFCTSTYSF